MYNQDVFVSLFLVGLLSLAIWFLVLYVSLFIIRLPVYHPFTMYLAYHLVGFIFRPFSVYYESYSFIWTRIGFTPTAEYIWITGIILNLALVSAVAGLVWGAGLKCVPLIPPTRFVINKRGRFFCVAFVFCIVGLYSTYLSYGSAGLDQVNAFETQLDSAGGQRLVGVSGYTLALQEALPILCIILLLSEAPKMISYSTTAIFIVMRLYVGAQRLSFIVVLAAAAMNQLIIGRRRYPTILTIVLILFGYVMFDIIGSDRYTVRRVFLEGASFSELWNSYVEKRYDGRNNAMDVVEFEAAAAAISIIDNFTGHSFGTQYLRLFIWPIPRQLWPSKPTITSTVNLSVHGFNFLYLTHSLYADLYMAFGLPFVIFGMFFWGWLMARIYNIALKTRSAAVYAFFWIFLIYMKTVLRDGGVTFVYFWAVSFSFAFLLIYAGGISIQRESRDKKF